MLIIILRSSPPPDWVWLVLLGSLGVVLLVLLLSRRYERRRTETLAAAAGHHGLSFEAEAEPLAREELSAFHLFTAGHSHRARNVMRGNSGGLDVVLFDYKYVTGGGKSQSTHQQTVAAFRAPGASLPSFQLRHENVFDRIASALGYQDIDFPDHAEFSRRYLLRGQDENAVRAAFSPALIDFFEQLAPDNRGWAVEGAGDLVVVYRPEKRTPAEELPQFLQDTTMVASQFRQGSTAKFGW